MTSGGYVGLSIATLLSQHHKVMAVDIVPEKVELINSKKSPIQDEYMAFVRMIYRDMRWNQDNTYRLEGKSIPGQQLVSFDLSSPFLVENGIALDENLSPTKPLCGEEMSSAESSSALPIKRGSGAV